MRSLNGRNRLWLVILIVISCYLLCPLVDFSRAQELSTSVYPSEDELFQALSAGEISYTQFVILLEIAHQGLNVDNAYLLDEIPNLAFFLTDSLKMGVALETDQKQPFEKSSPGGRLRGSVRYQYYQAISDEDRDRYRLSASLRLSPDWRMSWKVNREYSGTERVASRALAYTSRSGFLRKLTIGSLTARMGKGSVIGYRGKLLDYSKCLEGESMLYPDYGGFNGVYAVARSGPFEWQGLGSYSRDERHSLLTVAGSALYRKGRIRPGIVLGMNRLRNRDGGEAIEDFKAGINTDYTYQRGYFSLELTGQTGPSRGCGALVMEGRHRFEAAEIRYAAWAYGDRFLDLSSGSKAGNLSRRMVQDDIGFAFNSRRAGQEGALIKTVVIPSDGWMITSSAVLSSINTDTTLTEFMSSISRNISPVMSIRGDHLFRSKTTAGDDGIRHDDHRKTRLEVRLKSSHLTVRSYIAYAENDTDDGYFSVFGSARWVTTSLGNIEVWSNVGRLKKGVVEYWYFFVKHELDVSDAVVMGTKISNAYRRGGSDSNDPVLSLELRVQW